MRIETDAESPEMSRKNAKEIVLISTLTTSLVRRHRGLGGRHSCHLYFMRPLSRTCWNLVVLT